MSDIKKFAFDPSEWVFMEKDSDELFKDNVSDNISKKCSSQNTVVNSTNIE